MAGSRSSDERGGWRPGLPLLGERPRPGCGFPLVRPPGGSRAGAEGPGAQPAGRPRRGGGGGGARSRERLPGAAADGTAGRPGHPSRRGSHVRRARLGRLYDRPLDQVEEVSMEDLKAYIREVPNFPKPGILFYDITTLLQNPLALRMTVDRFVWFFSQKRIDKVVGIESRGFIFAPTVAYNLNAGFVPVRKPGKLPYQSARQGYDLEYGTDSIEMHNDAVKPGEQVLIIDDLIATGGTALAAAKLVESLGGKVAGFGFLVELTFLPGRHKLQGYEVESLIQY